MEQEANILFDLESIAYVLPDVAEFLKDTADIFPMPVRILYETFQRQRLRPTAVSGRRHLATMVIGPPDEQLVENLQQHGRDLERHIRTLVSSTAARTRACAASDVLEQRGTPHRRVQKTQFSQRYSEKFVQRKSSYTTHVGTHLRSPRLGPHGPGGLEMGET